MLTRNPSGRNKGSQSTPRRKEEAPKVSTRFSRTTADSFPAHMSGRQQQRRRATAARTARRFLTIVFVAKIPTSPGGRRQTRGRGDARTLSSLSQPTKTNPAAVSQRGCARGGRRLVRLWFLLQHSAVVAYAHTHKQTRRLLLFSVLSRSADRIFSTHARALTPARSSYDAPAKANRCTTSHFVDWPNFPGSAGPVRSLRALRLSLKEKVNVAL